MGKGFSAGCSFLVSPAGGVPGVFSVLIEPTKSCRYCERLFIAGLQGPPGLLVDTGWGRWASLLLTAGSVIASDSPPTQLLRPSIHTHVCAHTCTRTPTHSHCRGVCSVRPFECVLAERGEDKGEVSGERDSPVTLSVRTCSSLTPSTSSSGAWFLQTVC